MAEGLGVRKGLTVAFTMLAASALTAESDAGGLTDGASKEAADLRVIGMEQSAIIEPGGLTYFFEFAGKRVMAFDGYKVVGDKSMDEVRPDLIEKVRQDSCAVARGEPKPDFRHTEFVARVCGGP